MDSTYLKEYIAILDQLSEAGPNVSYQSPSMGGASTTQYDDGSSASNYDAGPLAVQQKKDPTGNMQSNRVRYNTGTDSVQVKNYASGLKKLTVHGPGEDAYIGPEASAQRLGVDPAKVNNFVNPSANTPLEPETMEEGDAELEEMRRLTYGTSDDIEEAGVGEGQTSDMRKFFSAEPGTASIPQVAARYRAYEEDMSEDADSTGVETRQTTLNTPAGDFTANITKDKSTNTVSGTMPVGGATLSATKDMTPGGAQTVSVNTNVAPNLNLSTTRKTADYNKGQLAGTKSVGAKYTDTTGALGNPGQEHTATRTAGVGFGGASGARVGKNYVDQYSVNEVKEDDLDAMRRLAFDKEELDEVGPQGYAGDDAAYNKYAGARATGDMLNKEMQPEKGVTSFTSPQAKAIATDLSTGLAGVNPEMEKRYTMNKLNTATPATDVSGELEEDDLDAMRRIINHRR